MSHTLTRSSTFSRKKINVLHDENNATTDTNIAKYPSTSVSSTDALTKSTFVRTRSMTRLAGGIYDDNKLGRIDRTTGKATAGKEEKEAGTGRRVLGNKMQSTAGTVMKRKMGSPGMVKKKLKTDEGKRKMTVLADVEPRQETIPRTPVREVVKQTADVQPTPARVILADKSMEEEDEDDEDEASPGIGSRFIARPPTPPRPHLRHPQPPIKRAVTVPTPVTPRAMDLDSPERHHPTYGQIPRTPTMPTQTPRRVMGSVSRFRAAPPSISRAATTTPARPAMNQTVLASILAAASPEETVKGEALAVSPTRAFRAAVPDRAAAELTTHTPRKVEREAVVDGDEQAVRESASAQTEETEETSKEDEQLTAPTQQAVGAEVLSIGDELAQSTEKDEVPQESLEEPQSETGPSFETAASPTISSASAEHEDDEPSTTTPAGSPPQPVAKPALVQSKLNFSPSASTKNAISNMPPPSRIPRAPVRSLPQPANIAAPAGDRLKKSSIPISTKPYMTTLGRGLPPSVPGASSTSSSAAGPSGSSTIRRKPSYPSSLGSGPMTRPRDRMVSGPTLYPQRDGTLATSKSEPSVPNGRQSPRSVSEPGPRPRAELATSMSRRTGMSMETSKSMAGLSDALNKLKMRKAEAQSEALRSRPSVSTLIATPAETVPAPQLGSSVSASSRLSSVHRPRQSLAPSNTAPADTSMFQDEEHAGDRSLAAILCTTTDKKCFKGVVAFVDVRTADGDDASPIFMEMLKSLGARVLTRPTENVTHIIYKSGKPTTLTWYRKQDEDCRPKIVGISWVTRSKEKNEKLDEGPFEVEVSEEDIFQKRRKSMEPKALMLSTAAPNQILQDGAKINFAAVRRKSMLYAPRVSSPLKKCHVARED